MADGDRAAVRVDARVLEVDIHELQAAEHLARESLVDLDDVHVGKLQPGALEGARRAGCHLVLEACESESADEQADATRRFLTTNVEGVILPPPLSESQPVLNELDVAGIPVVTVNTAKVEVEVYRIGDRNLVGTLDSGERLVLGRAQLKSQTVLDAFVNTKARGGDGGSSAFFAGSGGAGAGLGGGLFVAQHATVVVSDVNFLNPSAIGGNGGTEQSSFNEAAGGGGACDREPMEDR